MSEQPTPQPCTTCQGRQGQVVDTSSNGVTRQNWQSCSPCNGTGMQGGGN